MSTSKASKGGARSLSLSMFDLSTWSAGVVFVLVGVYMILHNALTSDSRFIDDVRLVVGLLCILLGTGLYLKESDSWLMQALMNTTGDAAKILSGPNNPNNVVVAKTTGKGSLLSHINPEPWKVDINTEQWRAEQLAHSKNFKAKERTFPDPYSSRRPSASSPLPHVSSPNPTIFVSPISSATGPSNPYGYSGNTSVADARTLIRAIKRQEHCVPEESCDSPEQPTTTQQQSLLPPAAPLLPSPGQQQQQQVAVVGANGLVAVVAGAFPPPPRRQRSLSPVVSLALDDKYIVSPPPPLPKEGYKSGGVSAVGGQPGKCVDYPDPPVIGKVLAMWDSSSLDDRNAFNIWKNFAEECQEWKELKKVDPRKEADLLTRKYVLGIGAKTAKGPCLDTLAKTDVTELIRKHIMRCIESIEFSK